MNGSDSQDIFAAKKVAESNKGPLASEGPFAGEGFSAWCVLNGIEQINPINGFLPENGIAGKTGAANGAATPANGLVFVGTNARFGVEDALFPSEMSYIAGAVPKRQSEFAMGRWCARRALLSLGIPPTVIGIGKGKSPIWPPKIVGSISHCHGYSCALVGNAKLGIGVDAEYVKPEGAQTIQESVLQWGEKSALPIRSDPGYVRSLYLVFSAKETLFKCLYPRIDKFFGFDAAWIFPDGNGAFEAVLQKDLGPGFSKGMSFFGRYFFSGNHVLTMMWSD